MSKTELRRHMLALRRPLNSHYPGASDAIASNFVTHFSVDAGHDCVSLYQAVGGEIGTEPLVHMLRGQGVSLALPVTHDTTHGAGPLSFRRYDAHTVLRRDAAGMHAPDATSDTCQPNFIVLPLLAFDAAGGRLGRGGGHYDRTLEALRQKCQLRAIGLAFDEQMVEECPMELHDQRLDFVVTPTRIVFCSGDKGS